MQDRHQALATWVGRHLGLDHPELRPASADASFRRYFRVVHGASSWVVMDAPPEQEDCHPFVQVAGHLHGLGVHVPAVHAADLSRGFLLLEDLGERLYLDALIAGADPDQLYRDAIEVLVRMQAGGWSEPGPVPDYDRGLMLRELALFHDWLLVRHLGRDAEQDRARLDALNETLLAAIETQPRVLVHRDFHSRNLMVLPSDGPGVLDFQDAVIGPVSYDLVSLLKDCYIAWPRDRVAGWVADFHAAAGAHGVDAGADPAQLLAWVDMMGVQRHLKAAGIFCRLHHRDGKDGYLADIPRTLAHIVDLGAIRPELGEFAAWLADEILPALARA